jgi:uncharacterized protein (TIGR03905 family)
MTFYIEGDVIQKVTIEGGCAGNTQGLSRLVVGMRLEEVVRRIRGIECGTKGTSCPDQMAHAIEAYDRTKRGEPADG